MAVLTAISSVKLVKNSVVFQRKGNLLQANYITKRVTTLTITSVWQMNMPADWLNPVLCLYLVPKTLTAGKYISILNVSHRVLH